MLTFRTTNIAFVLLLVLSAGFSIFSGLSWWVFAGVMFAYHIILFRGIYFVQSNFFMPMYCSAKTNEKVIALTFDDGPVAGTTPQILEILRAKNVKAAFFCIGHRVEADSELTRQIDAEGHVIGNHSYTHAGLFSFFSAARILNEMQQTDSVLFEAIRKRPRWFRQPYGVTNPNISKAVKLGNYLPVGWSVRSYDTMAKDPEKLLKKMVSRIKPGAVFLFHDTCQVTVNMLPGFIEIAKSKGYEIVRLDKMLNLPPYA